MKKTAIEVPGCKGTSVQEIYSNGNVQVMQVTVEPQGEIPLHKHDTAATMVIVSGSATALGKTCKYVKQGDVVVKAAHEPHGFSEIKGQFSFISISHGKGIMQDQGDKWDINYL